MTAGLVRRLRRGCASIGVVTIGVVLASCGAAHTTTHTTATTATAQATATQTTADDGVPPRPAATEQSRGRGRLLSPVLLYRLLADDPASSSYYVFFRTEGAFPRKFFTGTTIPGQIWIGDSWDNHDGFIPLGDGTHRGRCYGWGVSRTPELDRDAIGTPIRITLRLKRTTGVQQRTVRLRDAGAGFDTRRFREQLARLGCKM